MVNQKTVPKKTINCLSGNRSKRLRFAKKSEPNFRLTNRNVFSGQLTTHE